MIFFKIITILVIIYNCNCKVISNVQEKENKVNLKPCIRPCPSIYAPVCGFDGSSNYLFSSICDMEVQNCYRQVQRNHVFMQIPIQECHKQENDNTKKCEENCNKMYAPVCGFNGTGYKTFSNDCVFRVENCKTNYQWLLVNPKGKCHQ